MSATTLKLLAAASEVAGSDDLLAARLGIEPILLAAYMADRRLLPDHLLLAAVDFILADRQARAYPRGAEAVTRITTA